MRYLIALICMAFLGSTPLISEAKDAEAVPVAVKPFTENSTDALGVLNQLMIANRLKSVGQCVEASQLYRFILKYDPRLEDGVIGLAQCQIALGQADLALSALKSAAIESREIDVLFLLAKAQKLQSLERIVFLETKSTGLNDSRLFNMLGKSYLHQSDFEQAKIAYIRAHQSGQGKGLLENNLGIVALKQGDAEGAVSYFKQAKLYRPEKTRFDNNYRLALLLNHQYVEALSGLDAERANFFLYTASIIANSQGEKRLAETLLQQAINLSPTYFEAAEKMLQNL